MIQHVNYVLIGKKVPTTFTTVDALAAGDVALFDENRALITSADDAKEAASLYIGVAQKPINVTMPDGSVAQKANIKYGNEIKKDSHPTAVIGEYVAPVLDKIVIDLSNATIINGNRYVLRIVYKDIYEAPGQFTHTYETYATGMSTAAVAQSLVNKINRHPNRRVQATLNGSVITLTAMEKDDNEGVYSLSEYSVVCMEATLYTTIPSALLGNMPELVPGATVTKTEGNPGKGYWKQVRDAEVRYMGYQGHVFTGAYPEIEQARQVVEGAEYDYATVENDNKYLSNDNQYIKTTPLTTELYVEKGTLAGSVVAEGLAAFIACGA